jgi:hypothetical protein
VVFAALGLVRLLPDGYARAAAAAPIFLIVPGALTLGAVLDRRWRPQGVTFSCFAVLLSVLWSVFASLILYALHIRITLDSSYWCLLAVCGALSVAAQTRLLLRRPDTARHAASSTHATDPDEFSASELPSTSDRPGTPAEDADPPGGLRRVSYTAAAVVAGSSLLAGGTFAYLHVPRPVPVGYTSMAWTGLPAKGDIAIGPAGARLPFEILHQQSDTTTFRLSAAWIGASQQPLTRPVTLRIGPHKTIHGALAIPQPPGGCTYRIVVTLVAPGQIDQFTKQPETWSINVDVRSSQPSKTCAS